MSLGTTFPKTFTTFAPSGHLECELKKKGRDVSFKSPFQKLIMAGNIDGRLEIKSPWRERMAGDCQETDNGGTFLSNLLFKNCREIENKRTMAGNIDGRLEMVRRGGGSKIGSGMMVLAFEMWRKWITQTPCNNKTQREKKGA
jgi:hypothetical protein